MLVCVAIWGQPILMMRKPQWIFPPREAGSRLRPSVLKKLVHVARIEQTQIRLCEIVIDVGEIVADAVPMELCWKLGDGDGVKGGESTCGGRIRP